MPAWKRAGLSVYVADLGVTVLLAEPTAFLKKQDHQRIIHILGSDLQ